MSLKQILVGIAVIAAAIFVGWAIAAIVKIGVTAALTASSLSATFLHTPILFGATTWGGLMTLAGTTLVGALITGPFMRTFGRELGRVLDGKEGAEIGEDAGSTGSTLATGLDFSDDFVDFMGTRTGLGEYYVSGNPFPAPESNDLVITPSQEMNRWENYWKKVLNRKHQPCRCRF